MRVKRLLQAGCTAGLLVTFAQAANAATSPSAIPPRDCAAAASPYDYTATAAAKCFLIEPLISITPLPGGGKDYNYRSTTGQVISRAIPPAGFDPLTASVTELAQYALPQRPASVAGLEKWTQSLSGATVALPTPFIAAGRSPIGTPPAPAGPNAGAASPQNIFAGYQTNERSGGFDAMNIYYSEPSFGSESCPAPGYAIWAGLGDNHGTFTQDGTAGEAAAIPNHSAFWETFSNNSANENPQIIGTVAAHDSINAYVYYDTSQTSGVVEDRTTARYYNWSAGLFGGNPLTAEGLVEDPSGSTPGNLANFGTGTPITLTGVEPSYTTGSTSSMTDEIGDPALQATKANIAAGTASATTSTIANYGNNYSITYHHC